jgi:hypothetical protein
MLGTLVQSGTKALGGDKFSLVNLTPTALLVGFISALAASGAYGGGPVDLPKLSDLAGNAGWVVLAVFAVFVLAIILRPFQMSLVWLLEGYWPQWEAVPLAEFAVERHRRKRHTAEVVMRAQNAPGGPRTFALQAVADARRRQIRWDARRFRAQMVYERYPDGRVHPDSPQTLDDRLMPTVLGNVLRQGEDDAGDRYGLDLPTVSTRLYPFIQERIGTAINRNLDLIELGAALCVTFAIGGAASSPLAFRPDGWRAVPFVAVVLSFLAYRGALQTARSHGQLLATAFDLYRFDMVKALRYPLPKTVEEELDLNRQISEFLQGRNRAVDLMDGIRYVHPAADDTASGPAEPASAGQEDGRGASASSGADDEAAGEESEDPSGGAGSSDGPPATESSGSS